MGIRPYVIWICSEVNAADEPSRVSDGSSKNLISQLSQIVESGGKADTVSSHERDHYGDTEPPVMHEISSTPGFVGSAGGPPPIDVDVVEAAGHQAPDAATQWLHISKPRASGHSGDEFDTDDSSADHGWYTPCRSERSGAHGQ